MKTADRWKSNPYTDENGNRGCNEYVLKDFSSKSSLGGFEEYLLASPHILNRITGLINHDFRDNVFFLETQSHEFEQNDDYLIRCTCDYSNNTIIISFNGKELYSKYKKTCRSWAQARKYIIELINMLEDMKKEEGDDDMKQNVKVAKELLKLAKSLMASDDKNKYAIMNSNYPNSRCWRYPEDDDRSGRGDFFDKEGDKSGQEDFFDKELVDLITILIAILKGEITANTRFTNKGIIFKGKNLIDEILKRLKGIKHPLIKKLIALVQEVQSVFDKYGIPSQESKGLADQIERISRKIGVI